jgi:hypothetical protein
LLPKSISLVDCFYNEVTLDGQDTEASA